MIILATNKTLHNQSRNVLIAGKSMYMSQGALNFNMPEDSVQYDEFVKKCGDAWKFNKVYFEDAEIVTPDVKIKSDDITEEVKEFKESIKPKGKDIRFDIENGEIIEESSSDGDISTQILRNFKNNTDKNIVNNGKKRGRQPSNT